MTTNLDQSNFVCKYLANYKMLSEIAALQQGFSRKILKQLVWKRKIRKWKHPSGLTYWTRQSERPLSHCGFLRALTYEVFCSERQRRMINRQTLEEYFPQLFRNGLPQGYYIESFNGRPQLGLLRVDSQNSTLNRIMQKSRHLIKCFETQAEYKLLIQRRQFEICWAVFTDAKQVRINHEFQAVNSNHIKLQAVSLPLLLGIAAPIK